MHTAIDLFWLSPITDCYGVTPGYYPSEKQNSEEEIQRIITIVCNYFGYTHEEISTKSRKRHKVVARQFCMYFLREKTSLSLRNIGEMFPNSKKGKPRDHTTVIHSRQAIKDLVTVDEDIRRQFNALRAII